MRVLVVGGTGLIGGAVTAALRDRHEIVVASRNAPQYVDLDDSASIAALFERVGVVDAIVSASGHAPWGAPQALSVVDYAEGLRSKALGQIDLVLQGSRHLSDGGSFTLTSGILAVEPLSESSPSAVAGAAVEAFVRAAATELPRGQRLNAVRPTIVAGSPAGPLERFRGYHPVDPADLVLRYIRSIEGVQSGQVYEAYGA